MEHICFHMVNNLRMLQDAVCPPAQLYNSTPDQPATLETVQQAAYDMTIRHEAIDPRNTMGPTPFRKAAYVALIVVLFGVSSGWLGGV